MLPSSLRARVISLKTRLSQKTLIEKVARFVVCEKIKGDYFEFGVFRGDSLVYAYSAFEAQFLSRIRLKLSGRNEKEDAEERSVMWRDMRFFAFDSFEGLPAPADGDEGSEDFREGMFALDTEVLWHNLRAHGVPRERVDLVEGWFEDTCVPETIARHDMNKAAVVWIDSDLYSSAKTVLSFLPGLLQDGTVIVFDDWYSYKGNPRRGEQRAFNEWRETPEIRERFAFIEYQKEDWKRNSFIVSTLD